MRNFPKCLENFSARRFEISEKVFTGVGVDSFDVVDFLIFGTTRSQPSKYFFRSKIDIGGRLTWERRAVSESVVNLLNNKYIPVTL